MQVQRSGREAAQIEKLTRSLDGQAEPGQRSTRIPIKLLIPAIAMAAISGCALPSTVEITSDPTEAWVLVIEVHPLHASQARLVGTTPCKIKLSRGGLAYGHAVICEKPGFLPGGFSVSDDGVIFAKPEYAFHIELLPDHIPKLQTEGFSHTKEVGNRILESTSLYEEMLVTPRFMAGVPAARARSKIESLFRDIPQLRGATIEQVFGVLEIKVNKLIAMNTGSRVNNPLHTALVAQISYLLGGIKSWVASGPLARQ